MQVARASFERKFLWVVRRFDLTDWEKQEIIDEGLDRLYLLEAGGADMDDLPWKFYFQIVKNLRYDLRHRRRKNQSITQYGAVLEDGDATHLEADTMQPNDEVADNEERSQQAIALQVQVVTLADALVARHYRLIERYIVTDPKPDLEKLIFDLFYCLKEVKPDTKHMTITRIGTTYNLTRTNVERLLELAAGVLMVLGSASKQV